MNKDSKIYYIVLIIVLFGVTFLGSYLGNAYFEKKNSGVEKEIKKDKEEVKANIDNLNITFKTESKTFVAVDGIFKISNSMHYPIKISISKDAEKEMLDSLQGRVEKEYNSVNQLAKEQLDNYNKTYDPSLDGFPSPYGVSYSYNKENISLDAITFSLDTTGSMGGVSWDSVQLYNYSISTGKVLQINDVCNDVDECKNAFLEYFLNSLKNDERFANLNADYINTVKEKMFLEGSWGFDKGFKMVVDKYDIANGADGMFIYTMPVEEANKYLKEEYKLR